MLYDGQGDLDREGSQEKGKVSAVRGLRTGEVTIIQTSHGVRSVRKEMDAQSEEGDARVRREWMKSMDNSMDCSFKRTG